MAAEGVNYVKLAVDAPTLDRLGGFPERLAREVGLVGMMFADEEPDFALLARLAALGFKGAMLDTRDKTRGRLIAHLDVVRLNDFCSQCRELELDQRPGGFARGARRSATVASSRPDVLGFRGALCSRP